MQLRSQDVIASIGSYARIQLNVPETRTFGRSEVLTKDSEHSPEVWKVKPESLPAASTMHFPYGATTDRNGSPSSLWVLSLQVGKNLLFLLTIFALLYLTDFLHFIISKGSIMNHANFQISTFVSLQMVASW